MLMRKPNEIQDSPSPFKLFLEEWQVAISLGQKTLFQSANPTLKMRKKQNS